MESRDADGSSRPQDPSGPEVGPLAEEVRRLAQTVGEGVQQAAAAWRERQPEVYGHLVAAGSELLAAEPGLRIATQVLFGLPLAGWAVLRLRGPFRPIDWAIGAALVALTIPALFSADRQGSLDSVGLAMAWALLFWAMRDIGHSERLRRAVAVAGASCLQQWQARRAPRPGVSRALAA